MTRRQSNNQSNSGWFLNLVIIAMLGFLLFGVFGGAVMIEGAVQREVVIYPDIPAPAPEQLNYVPSVQTFAEPVLDACADPSAPVAGWEKGIGGQLPPCWATWTREQQNEFLRSH